MRETSGNFDSLGNTVKQLLSELLDKKQIKKVNNKNKIFLEKANDHFATASNHLINSDIIEALQLFNLFDVCRENEQLNSLALYWRSLCHRIFISILLRNFNEAHTLLNDLINAPKASYIECIHEFEDIRFYTKFYGCYLKLLRRELEDDSILQQLFDQYESTRFIPLVNLALLIYHVQQKNTGLYQFHNKQLQEHFMLLKDSFAKSSENIDLASAYILQQQVPYLWSLGLFHSGFAEKANEIIRKKSYFAYLNKKIEIDYATPEAKTLTNYQLIINDFLIGKYQESIHDSLDYLKENTDSKILLLLARIIFTNSTIADKLPCYLAGKIHLYEQLASQIYPHSEARDNAKLKFFRNYLQRGNYKNAAEILTSVADINSALFNEYTADYHMLTSTHFYYLDNINNKDPFGDKLGRLNKYAQAQCYYENALYAAPPLVTSIDLRLNRKMAMVNFLQLKKSIGLNCLNRISQILSKSDDKIPQNDLKNEKVFMDCLQHIVANFDLSKGYAAWFQSTQINWDRLINEDQQIQFSSEFQKLPQGLQLELREFLILLLLELFDEAKLPELREKILAKIENSCDQLLSDSDDQYTRAYFYKIRAFDLAGKLGSPIGKALEAKRDKDNLNVNNIDMELHQFYAKIARAKKPIEIKAVLNQARLLSKMGESYLFLKEFIDRVSIVYIEQVSQILAQQLAEKVIGKPASYEEYAELFLCGYTSLWQTRLDNLTKIIYRGLIGCIPYRAYIIEQELPATRIEEIGEELADLYKIPNKIFTDEDVIDVITRDLIEPIDDLDISNSLIAN